MRGGAHPADAAGDLRHVLGRAAPAEDLEAAQLGHLQVGALDVALVVEVDVDLAVALEPRDRVDRHVALGRRVGRVGPGLAGVEERFYGVVHGKSEV